jgi:peptidoglycan/LPS O-acetylase OafA/YrhL
MLRLVLATAVALAHSIQLSRGWQPTIGATQVGALAVDGFFVVSGFLVTMSLVRLGSVRRYAWHRFLRIAPGFYACLLVTTFVILPAISLLRGGSAGQVYDGPGSALDYLVNNAGLQIRQFTVDSLPGPVVEDDVVNGALWTLFYEALCYVLVAVLGVVAVIRRRPWVVLALLAVLQATTTLDEVGIDVVSQQQLPRLVLMFLLGAAAHLYADRIPVDRRMAAVSATVLLASLLLLDDYRALAAVPFAYLVMYAVVRLPLRQTPSRDLSYGMYIYHWPLTLLLLAAGLGAASLPLVMSGALLASAAAAAVSWRLVEAPALRHKSAAWVTRGRAARGRGRASVQ